jgi:hypothetical protein
MPPQELFFAQQTGDRRVEVLKTYDQTFAHEAFGSMDQRAQMRLWTSLRIADNYEPGNIPTLNDPDRQEFLWEELLDPAGEEEKYALVNDVLDQAVAEMRAIVLYERGVRDRVTALAEGCRTDPKSLRLRAVLKSFGLE